MDEPTPAAAARCARGRTARLRTRARAPRASGKLGVLEEELEAAGALPRAAAASPTVPPSAPRTSAGAADRAGSGACGETARTPREGPWDASAAVESAARARGRGAPQGQSPRVGPSWPPTWPRAEWSASCTVARTLGNCQAAPWIRVTAGAAWGRRASSVRATTLKLPGVPSSWLASSSVCFETHTNTCDFVERT